MNSRIKSDGGTNSIQGITFALTVNAASHSFTRTEDLSTQFRRFVLEVPNYEAKRLLILSIFNGPTDPNFQALLQELNAGMRAALEAGQQRRATGETTAQIETKMGTEMRSDVEWALGSQLHSEVKSEAAVEEDSTTDTSSETELMYD